MIAKKYKVPRELISFIMRKGEQYMTNLLILRTIKNEQHFSRYRVIVSRKVLSKAVDRNHLRSQIYESIRLNINEKTPGKDIIIIPKKKIIDKNYKEIYSECHSLMQVPPGKQRVPATIETPSIKKYRKNNG